MRAIGLLEGFAASAWAGTGDDKPPPELADAHGSCAEELRKAVMGDGD